MPRWEIKDKTTWEQLWNSDLLCYQTLQTNEENTLVI